MFDGKQGDLHPHLNSSNLVPPVLKQFGQFRGKLAQFGGHCAIIRCKRQDLTLKLHYMAGARQGGRRNLLIMALQSQQLSGLTGKLAQFRAGTEV